MENKYGAIGRGLHEKASSVSNKISNQCMKKIRYIASVRNKAAHEDRKIANQEIKNIRVAYKAVLKELAPKKFNWGLALFVIAILIAAIVAAMKFMK
ncbi:MAG: hypothetical protein IKS45_03915 [Thermoguttaceae bacterium]|nr:hypothetical protein [Thermoguttaceae bacterium]